MANEMNTKPMSETAEAWDAVSRTPDGMYDSRVPISQYAYAMAEHSRKMEHERDAARRAHSSCCGVRDHWKAETMTLREAAQAVVDRWDTPLWKDAPATAEYINRLRALLPENEKSPDAGATE